MSSTSTTSVPLTSAEANVCRPIFFPAAKAQAARARVSGSAIAGDSFSFPMRLPARSNVRCITFGGRTRFYHLHSRSDARAEILARKRQPGHRVLQSQLEQSGQI